MNIYCNAPCARREVCGYNRVVSDMGLLDTPACREIDMSAACRDFALDDAGTNELTKLSQTDWAVATVVDKYLKEVMTQ